MERTKIEVPKGIRYLSDWGDFCFANFPDKCIINKQLPGCGFTEWCIRSKDNLILCSPRKHLLKNKADQHKGEVYLVVNEMEKGVSVDKDLSKTSSNSRYVLQHPKEPTEEELKKEEEDNLHVFERIENEIREYYKFCLEKGIPMKILVTYDSYRIVQEILRKLGIYHLFATMVDEFQSILHDSRFKASTELQFMTALETAKTVYFVSATPMLDEYLEMLDEFKDLPYFELDWATQDPLRITIPVLDVKAMRSATEECCKVIKEFLDGKFEEVVVERDGKLEKVISNKIVIYMNSVKHILSVTKKMKLTPDRVNFIIADTEENRKKIQKKLGKKFGIGSIPLKDDPEPDITFCTRTVYLGADFYSKCARSYIFSDSNVDCLAVDISEDLPQILGRQRLDENPWKNHAYFFYRATADYRSFKKEDFDKVIKTKLEETNNLLDVVLNNKTVKEEQKKSLILKYRKDTSNYKDDYVSINIKIDDNGAPKFIPVLNKLVMANEMRAFRIQQIDYKDRFTVFSTLQEKITPNSVVGKKVSEFMRVYMNVMTNMSDKLKYLCEISTTYPEYMKTFLNQISDSDEAKSYYIALGKDRLRSLGYNVTRVKKDLGIVIFNPLVLENAIYEEFKEGDKLLLSEIKTRLSNLYKSINYDKTPKAVDLLEFFEVKKITTLIDDGKGGKKKINGYRLVKKLK